MVNVSGRAHTTQLGEHAGMILELNRTVAGVCERHTDGWYVACEMYSAVWDYVVLRSWTWNRRW